jgi:hypothetical protein
VTTGVDEHDQGEGLGEDPQDCPACVAAGDLCRFHTGFAEGWDACAELVARMVAGDA